MPMEIRTMFVFGNGERLVRKGHDGIFWSDGNVLYVIDVVVIQMYTVVKVYQTVYLWCMHFIIYKLYFKKAINLFYFLCLSSS